MAHKMPHTAARKLTKADLTQVPIEHIDLEKVRNIADLLDGYERISFQARSLGQCAHILERAMLDPECTIFFGAAGRSSPAASGRSCGISSNSASSTSSSRRARLHTTISTRPTDTVTT